MYYNHVQSISAIQQVVTPTEAVREGSTVSDAPPHSQGSDHQEGDNKATPFTMNYI